MGRVSLKFGFRVLNTYNLLPNNYVFEHDRQIYFKNKQILQNFQELSNNPILFSILDQSLNNIKSQASKIYTKCIRTNGPWITINKNFKKRGAEKKYPINATLKSLISKKAFIDCFELVKKKFKGPFPSWKFEIVAGI